MEKVFLTPSASRFLGQVNASAAAPDYSPAAQRAGLDGAMAQLGWAMPDGAAAAEILELDSGATVHLFRPPGVDGVLPLALYIHGGSFFAGGAASHGPFAAKLAEATGAAVALVDYRLAPEHKAPAALHDCVAGLRAVLRQAGRLRVDPDRVAVVGDSAGGALAAGVALATRGEVGLRLLALVNPMTTPAAADASMRDYAAGYFAGARDFAEGWAAYGQQGEASAFYDLLAVDDLSGLPPTIILTNEADPVRDQGERFAEKLSAAGVTVLSLRTRGLFHAAWLLPAALPEADLLLATVAGAARAILTA